MTKLSDHHSSEITKVMVLGDPGSGKTGALASLADAGFNLRIVDIDNGLDVLKNLLRDPRAGYSKDAISRVEFETITDPLLNKGGKLFPSKATVWPRVLSLLDNWSPKTTATWPNKQGEGKNDTAELGPITTWGAQDILVIDTLSILADKSLDYNLMLNARLGQKPHQADWGSAQDDIKRFLEKLYDDNVRCNVVVNCHIKYIEDETGIEKAYPESAGKALSPKIGRYFNSVLLCKTVGKEHKLITASQAKVELKTTNPVSVKPEYLVKDGLAQYFKDVRGQ